MTDSFFHKPAVEERKAARRLSAAANRCSEVRARERLLNLAEQRWHRAWRLSSERE